MAVTIPATGSGTATPQVATDVISSVHYQQMKIVDGTTGSTNALIVDSAGRAHTATVSDVVAAVTAAWTSATALNTALSLAVTNYSTVLLSINPTSTFTGGAIIFEVSDDGGTTWYPVAGERVDSFTSETSYTIVASQTRMWQFDVTGATNFRVRLNPAITGTGTLNVRLQANAAACTPGVTVGGTVGVSGTVTVSGSVSITGTATVSGTVTANIGTTNGLALDATLTGGTTKAIARGGQKGTTNTNADITHTASGANHEALDVALYDASGNQLGLSASPVRTDPTGTTTQPVSGTVTANQGGTWTVQPGNTANTTPWLTTNTPGTSGGYLISRLLSAATTNATNVKASAGQVFGWYIFNTSAATKFVKLYNKATAPTVGTDTPVMTIPVPAGGGANVEFMNGIAFATGIGFAITGAVADADTTAVAANDVILNLFYK